VHNVGMTHYADNVPLYARIAAVLRQRMDEGEMKIGDMLPSLEVLMVDFDASRVTLRLAMDALAAEGLIERRRGFGTHVVARPRNAREVNLPMRWEQLVARLADVKRTLLAVDTETTPSHDDLNLLANANSQRAAKYVHMLALHHHGGMAYCHVDSWIDAAIYKASRRALEKQPALRVLNEQHRDCLARVEQTLTIGLAEIEVARALDIVFGTPVALVRRTLFDREDRCVYAAHIRFPANVVKIETTFLP
jgi:GntR family transcriptional regulator